MGLVQVQQQYEGRGVEFLSLTEEGAGELENVRTFVERTKIPWPVGYGALPTLTKLEVLAPPMTFVVARDGTVTWNSLRGGTLDGAIRQVL